MAAQGTSTKAWVAGAAGIGVAATRLARGRRSDEDAAAGPGTHAVTVLGPVDAVRAAWEASGSAGPGLAADFRPAPGDRGTEVRIRPATGDAAGAAGAEGHEGHEGAEGSSNGGPGDAGAADDDPQSPDEAIRAELRAFKARFEAGEVVTTAGQPTGRSPRQEAATRTFTKRLRAWGAS